MTLREKIADWISGGAVSHQKKRADKYRNSSLKFSSLMNDETIKAMHYLSALIEISDMETPKAAHAAKKMAAVANEALGKTDNPVKVAP